MDSISTEFIVREATNYFQRYDEDALFEMLVEEWQRVEHDKAAIRGDLPDYLRGVVQRIAKGVVKNEDVVAATMEAIVSEVMCFLTVSGYDLAAYRIPISVLVAVVAKALVRQLGIRLRDLDK